MCGYLGERWYGRGMPPPSQTFSKRQGYNPPSEVKPETRTEVSPAMRHWVGQSTKRWGISSVALRTIAWDLLKDDIGTKAHEIWSNFHLALQGAPWFSVYDVIEALHAAFEHDDSISLELGLLSDGPFPKAPGFERDINDYLAQEGIPWQLVNGGIVTRGSEAFEGTVKTAVAVLVEDKKTTAAGHFQFAINALSARPKANTSGAVAHATNAVECVLGEVTGQTMTLGKYLDKNPALFHPALKKGLDGIYGYASDEGARHGKEGTEPSYEEAEFVVATCAAVCTLLTRKHAK